MKPAPLKLVVLVFCGMLTISLLSSVALAIEHFHDQEWGFSIDIPDGYVKIAPPHPQALLAVAPVQGGFPTFNIVVQSGSVPYKLSAPVHGEMSVEAYKKTGITDVSLLKTATYRNGASALLQYPFSGELYLSSVTVVPAGTDHYLVLTFICKESDFGDKSTALELFLSSFRVDPAFSTSLEEEQKSSFQTIRKTILYALILIILLSGIGILIRYRKINR